MPLAPLGQRLHHKRTLYFRRSSGRVVIRGEKLVHISEKKEERGFEWKEIRRVVLLGRVNVDISVLYFLLKKGISVDWLDIFGKPMGLLLPLLEAPPSRPCRQDAFRDTRRKFRSSGSPNGRHL